MSARRHIASLAALAFCAGASTARADEPSASTTETQPASAEASGDAEGASPTAEDASLAAAPSEQPPIEESVDAPIEEPPPGDGSFELPVFGRTTFAMTSTSTVRFRGQNYDNNPLDDDFFSAQQRFDLALQGDELRLELRLDGFLPFGFAESPMVGSTTIERPAWFGDAAGCTAESATRCYLSWDARPERIALRWEHESWLVELGDTQLVLGRGAALSFRKVDLLGVDNALRGVHVRYDDGHFRVRAHAGVANPQNQDPLTLRIFQDPLDVFLAGSVGATILPNDLLTISAHIVRAWFENDPEGGSTVRDRSMWVYGWTAEMPSLADGHLALYAEANASLRDQHIGTEAQDNVPGRSVYASAQYLDGGLTILAEWKDYRNFLVAPSTLEGNPWRIYGAAPSLEFDGPQRLRAIGNQRGGSLRIDYAFLPGPWSFSVNGSVYGLAEQPSEDPWDGVLVTHGWVTLARRQEYGEDLVWSTNVSAGYRQETFLHDPQLGMLRPGDVDRRMIHGQVEVTVGSGDHSLDLNVDHRYEEERQFNGSTRSFQIGGGALTYSLGVQLTLTLGLRWSDFKPNEVEQRGLRDYNLLGGALYPSLEARWNFDPGTFVRGFFGSTPGGQICSGGVCREVPAFEGFLLQFVGRV